MTENKEDKLLNDSSLDSNSEKNEEDKLSPEGNTKDRSKHKRRSKEDDQGRDFTCGCSKRYLSYPALYTHIKTKHGGVTPIGTTAPLCTTGRSRGRPRKYTDESAQKEEQVNNEPQKPQEIIKTNETKNKMTIECIVKSEGHKKKEVKSYNGDEVLKRLGVLSETKKDPIKGFNEFLESVKEENKSKYADLQQELEMIEKHEKNVENTCLHVLCEYLYEIGLKVTEEFYKTLIIFIRLYKESLNEYGWEIRKKQQSVSLEERKLEFSKKNSAEYIPDLCNDFINYYLPKEFPAFDKLLAMELTRHLCDWVHRKGYSKKAISLM